MTGSDAISLRVISETELVIHSTVLTVFCFAVLAITVVSQIALIRRPEIRHDMQCSLYLARRVSLIASAVLLLGAAAVLITIGVAFLQDRPYLGWAFFPMAGMPLSVLWIRMYVLRLPFSYPEDL